MWLLAVCWIGESWLCPIPIAPIRFRAPNLYKKLETPCLGPGLALREDGYPPELRFVLPTGGAAPLVEANLKSGEIEN